MVPPDIAGEPKRGSYSEAPSPFRRIGHAVAVIVWIQAAGGPLAQYSQISRVAMHVGKDREEFAFVDHFRAVALGISDQRAKRIAIPFAARFVIIRIIRRSLPTGRFWVSVVGWSGLARPV